VKGMDAIFFFKQKGIPILIENKNTSVEEMKEKE
jgi:hypothetical protein